MEMSPEFKKENTKFILIKEQNETPQGNFDLL